VKATRNLPIRSFIGGLALALALATAAPSARANVFASNIKINGGMTNITVAPGTNVTISYILNEPASAGVSVKIFTGATTVRTIAITSGPGTARGTNTVTWDGKADGGASVPGGNYSVSITAASQGYAGWTKTTDDDNPGNYTYDPMGIAVDRNTNSPYYGRVFVGNSVDNTEGLPNPLDGDYLGIQKLNADGSYADEGGFSDGGVAWHGQGAGPWKIRVSEDDYVYVEDQFSAGDIYRFDGTISSNSMLHAFAAVTTTNNWTGFQVVGQGTNTVLWAADDYGTMGISTFSVNADGTFDANAGTQVVAAGGSPGMDVAPYAVAVDTSGIIYTIQNIPGQGNGSPRVFRYPAYDPIINSNMPELTADWELPAADDAAGGHGIAVDPTGTYVAAAFRGYGYSTPYTLGNIKILKAADGMIVTNLDLGVAYTNNLTSDPTNHWDTATDWDAVGNLYYTDEWPGCWRTFSPPGTNQATTVALAMVQVTASVVPPYIQSIGISGAMVVIHFIAGSSDTPSMFTLLSSSAANGTYSPASGAVITGGSGSFQATVPKNGPVQFYRILRSGTPLPHITSLNVSGGTATVSFTGASSDTASSFTLLSSAAVNGTYSVAGSAVITQLSPGSFQATVATSGPHQFYRVSR
jgi:hypothetical protein